MPTTAQAQPYTPVVNNVNSSPRPPRSQQAPSRLVQMRLLDATVEAVDHVKRVLKASSRTDAVVRCIDIARTVIDAVDADGMSVHFVGRDGTIERLVIPGLTPPQRG